jgi:hypothetical protein
MADSRMNFFGLGEDKLYYDERKKRFVNTKDAPGYVERAYKNSHFKDVSCCRYRTRMKFALVTTRLVRPRKARVPNQVEVGTAIDPPDELPNKARNETTLAPARRSQL